MHTPPPAQLRELIADGWEAERHDDKDSSEWRITPPDWYADVVLVLRVDTLAFIAVRPRLASARLRVSEVAAVLDDFTDKLGGF
jgi:hypothetical protein